MADLRRTASSSDLVRGAWSTALRGGTLASKFLLVLVLARFFSPGDLGIYGLMVSTVVIGLLLLGLEYKYFAVRALIASPAQARAGIIRDQIVLYGIVALLLLPVLALVLVVGNWTPIPRDFLPWLFAILLAELAAQEGGNSLLGLSRPVAANAVLFIRTGVWVFPVAMIAIANPSLRQISVVFVAWFLGSVASAAVAAWCLRGLGWREAIARPVDWQRLRLGLRTILPFLVTSAAGVGLLFFDRFVIEAYHGVEAVGVYTLFASVATALHTLVNAGISLVRMPRLVGAYQAGDRQVFQSELRTMTRLTALSSVLLGIAMAAAVLPILQIVGRSVYDENVGVFYVLLATVLIRACTDPWLYALYAKHEDLKLLATNLVAFFVAVIANLALVPPLGLYGAAFAAAAGAVVFFLMALALSVHDDDRAEPARRAEALSIPL